MINLKAIQTQRGSALIICLVLLMVLSLIGISSVENSILEEKMSVNTQAKSMIFQITKSEAEVQFSELGDNSLPIVNAIEVNINLDEISESDYADVTSVLAHIGEFERRARRKEEIQSMGTSQVIVTELTVSASSSSTGATSAQAIGLELALPST